MKKHEGILKELVPFDLYQKKQFVTCPYCESCILPGYMNVVKHWSECLKNPNRLKAMENPLIDEIKRNIKF